MKIPVGNEITMHSSQVEGWTPSSYMRPSNWYLCHQAFKDKNADEFLLDEAPSGGKTRSYTPVVTKIKLSKIK